MWAYLQAFLDEHHKTIIGLILGSLVGALWSLYRRLKALEASDKLDVRDRWPSFQELQRAVGDWDERIEVLEEDASEERSRVKEVNFLKCRLKRVEKDLKQVENETYKPRLFLNKEGVVEVYTPRREGQEPTVQKVENPTAWDRILKDD